MLVLAIGLGGGFYSGYQIGQANSIAFNVAEMEYYFTYSAMQMAEGTDATREKAIRGHLALIEKRRGHESAWLTTKVLATDSALAYVRLYALAKKRGASKEAEEYLNQAVAFCPQIGWRDCSAEKLTRFTQRLDKHGLFEGISTQNN